MKSGDIVIYRGEVGTVVTDYDNREVMRFLPCNYGTYSTSRLKAITEDDVSNLVICQELFEKDF